MFSKVTKEMYKEVLWRISMLTTLLTVYQNYIANSKLEREEIHGVIL